MVLFILSMPADDCAGPWESREDPWKVQSPQGAARVLVDAHGTSLQQGKEPPRLAKQPLFASCPQATIPERLGPFHKKWLLNQELFASACLATQDSDIVRMSG